MDAIVFLSFLGTAVLLTLMPGPDILFVIAQSISQSQKAGIITALGLCTGLLFHITAAVLGISAAIYQSAVAFSVVKTIGAVYLLYLAWQAFRAKETKWLLKEQQRRDYTSLYKKGILMNVLNPKVSLFFLALLPQFVNHTSGNVSGQMVILGLTFIVQALVVFSIVSFFSDQIRRFLGNQSFISRNANYIQGILFVIIGLQIAFGKR